MSLMNKQLMLEEKYSSNQAIPKLMKIVKETDLFSSEDKEFVKWAEMFTCHLLLHKRFNIETAVGLTKGLVDTPQQAADYVTYLLENYDLFQYSPVTKMLTTVLELPEDIERELRLYMFPPPLVVLPNKIKNNRDSGYLLQDNKRSVMLGKAHTEEDVCLDVLNILNAIPHTFDHYVVENTENTFKNTKSRKPGESLVDYKKRIKQFARFNKESRLLIQEICDMTDVFYFDHAYCMRGRIYSRGYHVNYQGNEWAKGVVAFGKKEIIEE